MGKSIFDLSTNGIQIPQNLVKYANSKYLSRYANADDMEKKYFPKLENIVPFFILCP